MALFSLSIIFVILVYCIPVPIITEFVIRRFIILLPVFRIRDILIQIWIRILGSAPFKDPLSANILALTYLSSIGEADQICRMNFSPIWKVNWMRQYSSAVIAVRNIFTPLCLFIQTSPNNLAVAYGNRNRFFTQKLYVQFANKPRSPQCRTKVHLLSPFRPT